MNGYELKKLCAQPLRKRATDDDAAMRKLVYGGVGAGTGALINHLIGNRSLVSYLLGGGVGAIGGLGLERALNSGGDTARQSKIDQLHEIENTLGRELTKEERDAYLNAQRGFDPKYTYLIGIPSMAALEGTHIVKGGFKPDSTFNVKKFIEQQGPNGAKYLDNLTSDYIKTNKSDPLVAEYNSLKGNKLNRARRNVLWNQIQENVAGMNRNYLGSNRNGLFNRAMRWAHTPGRGIMAAPKYVLKNYGGHVGRILPGFAIGAAIDAYRYWLAQNKANYLTDIYHRTKGY